MEMEWLSNSGFQLKTDLYIELLFFESLPADSSSFYAFYTGKYVSQD
jgi:hypothetical protein